MKRERESNEHQIHKREEGDEEQMGCGESESPLKALKKQCLGSKKPRKRVIEPTQNQKFRFSFDWDTFHDMEKETQHQKKHKRTRDEEKMRSGEPPLEKHKQFMGSKKPRMKVIIPTQKFRFSFNWETFQDTDIFIQTPDRDTEWEMESEHQKPKREEDDEEQMGSGKPPLEEIKKQCLGSKKPRMRVIKSTQKFRFSFNWDTFLDMDDIAET